MTSVVRPAHHRLSPHPGRPCGVVDEVGVELEIEPRVVRVRYAIATDLGRLRVPSPEAPLDPERLWAHTCCELFVAAAQGDAYAEWNFSPTGQIARFEFDGYRSRRPSQAPVAAESSVCVEPGVLRIDATVPLPAWLGDAGRLGPTAVIEDADGGHSYWALRHPGDQPDFHHRDGLALAWSLSPPPARVGVPLESP